MCTLDRKVKVLARFAHRMVAAKVMDIINRTFFTFHG